MPNDISRRALLGTVAVAALTGASKKSARKPLDLTQPVDEDGSCARLRLVG